MVSQKSEAGAEAGPDVLCDEHPATTETPSKKQPIKGAPTHLIGSPAVIVTNRKTETLVCVSSPPWGWGKLDRIFLHPPLHARSKGVERYALELRQRFADAAWKEHARREHLKDLKLREAIARNGGGR